MACNEEQISSLEAIDGEPAQNLCETHAKQKFGDDCHKIPGTRSLSRIPGSSVVRHLLK